MKFTAQQIAGILEGTIEGNPNAEVYKLSKIEEGSTGSLTFLANPKYTAFIYNTKATATIVANDFVVEKPITTTLIRVEDAYKAFSKLLAYYNQVKLNKMGVEDPHFIGASTNYGEAIYIGAFAYIGEQVSIGNNVKIYPNPVEDKLYVELKEFLPKNASILIFDELGKRVYTSRIYGGWNNYDVSQLSSGFYFISIVDDTPIYTGKLIIQW